MRHPARLISLAVLTAATTATALPALANDSDVIRRGNCSGTTNWKLKASPENGRIEVEGEIDSNKVGQSWSWKLKHNGSLSAKGQATTKAPSGSFERSRTVVNAQGDDTLVFRAENVRSGEVCRARLVF
jgi:hypothetical protein